MTTLTQYYDLTIRPDNIPDELKQRKAWGQWYSGKPKKNGCKPAKIIIETGADARHKMESNDPKTWSEFETTVDLAKRFGTGVATVIETGSGWIGIDLDNCFDEDGIPYDWAIEIIEKLEPVAYGEISASGKGVKYITRAEKPEWAKGSEFETGPDGQKVEIFAKNRLWCVTGNIIGDAREIGDGQAVIDWLYEQLMPDDSEDFPVVGGKRTTQKTSDKEGPVTDYVHWMKPDPAELYEQCCKQGTLPPLVDFARGYMSKVQEPKEHTRNNKTFLAAGHLLKFRRNGERLTPSEVADVLIEWSRAHNDPLDPEEIVSASDSAARNGTPPEPVELTSLDYTAQELLVAAKFRGDWKAAAMWCSDELANTIDCSGLYQQAGVPQVPEGVKKKYRRRIRNYRMETREQEDGTKKQVAVPLSMQEVCEHITERCSGWPKAAAGVLFVKTSNGIRELSKYQQFMGWLATQGKVSWKDGNIEGYVSKREVFEQLPYEVERFDAVEAACHFPPKPNHYYACEYPEEPGDGSHLEQFVDFFSPASDVDRQLIVALIVTTMWGGPPGKQRPFVIDSATGTGSGKTTLAHSIARLTGAPFDFRANQKVDEIKKEILTPSDQHRRVAIIDNIKSRLASGGLESLLTTPTISGRGLYLGTRTVPNNLIWVVTGNGVDLGRDMAHRFAILHLVKPKYGGGWDTKLDAFLAEHTQDIIADVAGFFERPKKPIKNSRWGVWEDEIVSRLDDPDLVLEVLADRTEEADEDRDAARSLEQYVQAQLTKYGYDVTKERVHIQNSTMATWFTLATGRELTTNQLAAAMKQLKANGSLRLFEKNTSNTYGRGWVWSPRGATGHIRYNLKDHVGLLF